MKWQKNEWVCDYGLSCVEVATQVGMVDGCITFACEEHANRPELNRLVPEFDWNNGPPTTLGRHLIRWNPWPHEPREKIIFEDITDLKRFESAIGHIKIPEPPKIPVMSKVEHKVDCPWKDSLQWYPVQKQWATRDSIGGRLWILFCPGCAVELPKLNKGE